MLAGRVRLSGYDLESFIRMYFFGDPIIPLPSLRVLEDTSRVGSIVELFVNVRTLDEYFVEVSVILSRSLCLSDDVSTPTAGCEAFGASCLGGSGNALCVLAPCCFCLFLFFRLF